ncbi:MAG: glycosyltransferase [Pseudomonadales bacterium]
MSSSETALSVVLPIRNEALHIEATLSQLLEQSLEPERFEVLVVDGESDDNTPVLVQRFIQAHPSHQIRLLTNPIRLSSGARNLGAREAKGDYILIVDGHVELPSQTLLEDCLEQCLQHQARCLGRPQPLNPTANSDFQNLVYHARQSRLAHSNESHIFSEQSQWVSPISVAVMYHKSVFAEVGSFDEAFDAAEDLEFNYRLEKAGIQCLISPKFAVKYYPRSTFAGLFKQLQRYGRGRAKFVVKHPERFRPELVVPALAVCGVIGAVLLIALGGSLRWLGYAGLGGYFGVLVGDTLLRGLSGLPGSAIYTVPALIATVHMGLGTGFMLGLFETLRRRGSKDPAG